MDQDTRNKLQRATQQVRRILEEEFAEQLEGTFDILPDGKILPKPGKHLDARQGLTRQKLVDAIEHIKAGGKKPPEAVDEYTREAAFTFLNRFVALRMLEARGLLQECVAKGDESSGFKEFCGLAPGLASLEDGGYRLYLECLFDELSVEVKVLFDRRDPASLLWPRRGALTELLDILDQADLAGIWSEDETIGWVYQYFNSGEERKKMRDESQAPRNSRELAVRNQFFTPRYVVEFLTDNTLGRIWYEMRRGETRLVDECRYLVRRPSEVFLDEGQEAPPGEDSSDGDADQDLSQEELLKKTVYIPHRAKKDPRDLKILDPACGSGHFLLYAFDLLITIYEEAWHDDESPASEVTGKRLREDYPELEQLHAALPGMVLAHNLHGIDIDPRATQIAALALWMRGQRAYNDASVSRECRPLIAKSNIVCAEPMPGEKAFLDEFIAKHLPDDAEGRFLASLVRKVFEAMKLAGEAGSLLKIEEDIAEEVAKAKKQWLERPEFKQKTLFDAAPKNAQKELDLTHDITDESFWEEAEHRIYDALRVYSERAEHIGGFQRRLFAVDAARGFAFIDLCRQRYDVLLMNPPFGPCSASSKDYVFASFARERIELGGCFVTRFLRHLAHGGKLGVIANRTLIFSLTLDDWRFSSLQGTECLADLGHGVLDALVETACWTVTAKPVSDSMFFGLIDAHDKEASLRSTVTSVRTGISSDAVIRHIADFSVLFGRPFAYWAPSRILGRINQLGLAENRGLVARQGLATCDNFRFLRLLPELPPSEDDWMPLTKGGEYQPFWADVPLRVKWSENGRELKAYLDDLHGQWSRVIQSADLYGTPGATYSERTASSLSLRVLPAGSVFDKVGPFVGADSPTLSKELVTALIGLSYTTPYRFLVETAVGLRDATTSGSAARHYLPSIMPRLPLPKLPESEANELTQMASNAIHTTRDLLTTVEPNSAWHEPHDWPSAVSIAGLAKLRHDRWCSLLTRIYESGEQLERLSATLFGADERDTKALHDVAGRSVYSFPRSEIEMLPLELQALVESPSDELISQVCESRGAHATTYKKAYWADRNVELVCILLQAHPLDVISAIRACEPSNAAVSRTATDVASIAVGVLLGHLEPATFFADSRSVLPADPFSTQSNYGITRRSHDSEAIHAIFVDDEGHTADVVAGITQWANALFGGGIERELADDLCLKGQTLRRYVSHEFFGTHIARYSEFRRKAPIYWQLATPSASYSVWLYYHRFTKDTFFNVKKIVKDKLGHERQKLDRLRSEAGAEPTRSQRKEIEDQEKFVTELASMTEEVERIAPLWNPNLNDGVIINFAPLWRLVPQNKSWQKECKKCWDKLVKGDYDWAHLAMHLWPERVVPKCVTDASLAIAHGLEETFWTQDDRNRFQPKKEPQGGWEPVIRDLVEERTSPAVKAALESLLTAPAPAGNTRSRRRKATK